MLLKSLELTGFRSFAKKTSFHFNPKFTLITGPNSVGKTNLLEAIYFVSKAGGFRDKKTVELINNNSPFSTARAAVEDDGVSSELTVKLTRKDRLAQKNFSINGLAKLAKQYYRRVFKVVLFQPEDLMIISGTPDKRRHYFDSILCQVDYQYSQAKQNYSRGLYKRNRVLEKGSHYDKLQLQDLLRFWDKYLSENILLLQERRRAVVNDFNKHPSLNGLSFEVCYQQNSFIDSSNLSQLKAELEQKRTLSGAQLDDFSLRQLNGQKSKVLSQYGSRSEQRLCVLWLKLNELRYTEQQTQKRPLLLMDDIFSELDKANSERILTVSKNYQTLVTTAHLEVLPLFKKAGLIKADNLITLGP
jgi:DNA replication and repair protein RecF